MGVIAINPAKYGRLLSRTLPKVIESDRDLDRMAALLEELDFAGRKLTAEETALRKLLVRLIEDYDSRQPPLPEVAPHKILQFLMEQRGLRQADLVPVVGSRAQVSDMVSGKRGISKKQAKNLAEFFHVSPEIFI